MSDVAVDYLAGRGVHEATVLEYGITYDVERHALRFPYYDCFGREFGARYRLLSENANMKYLSEKSRPQGLYNVIAVDSPLIWVCEGEIDALSLLQTGRPVVGVPGAESFREAWRYLFVEKDVRIVFDGDDAGASGARRISRILNGVAREVEIVELPEGQDVNSLYVVGELERWLQGGVG